MVISPPCLSPTSVESPFKSDESPTKDEGVTVEDASDDELFKPYYAPGRTPSELRQKKQAVLQESGSSDSESESSSTSFDMHAVISDQIDEEVAHHMSRPKSPAIKFGSSMKTSSSRAPVKETASGADAQGYVCIPKPTKSPKLKDTEETPTSNFLPKPSAFHSSFNPPNPKLKPTTECPIKEASQKASSSTSLKAPSAPAPDTNSKSTAPPNVQIPPSPQLLRAPTPLFSKPPKAAVSGLWSPWQRDSVIKVSKQCLPTIFKLQAFQL
jgi:hypothetical protein